MKKILILSYHFPPMNVIASQRALGYANHFKKFGFEPTILTFDWSKKIEDQYCTKSDFELLIKKEINDEYSVIRIPVLRNNFLDWMGRKEGSVYYKFWVLKCWFTGDLDVRPDVIAFGRSEKYYIENFIKTSDYDVVLGIFSPHFHLKNCFEFNRKKGISYALDFRDLWTNTAANIDQQTGFVERIRDRFIKKYWKRFSSKAKLLSIVGNEWVKELSNFTQHSNVLSIYNGFENDLVSEKENVDFDQFRIVYSGTLYEWQDYQIMIDGIQDFLINLSLENRNQVEIHFPGTRKPGFEVVLDYITNRLGEFNLNLTERIPKEEALKIQRNANVLLFATSSKIRGFYSGKIFEYISSGTPIFAGPLDEKAVCDLINETGSGFIYNDQSQLSNLLADSFKIWEDKSSFVLNNRNLKLIREFSRENQTKILASEINKTLHDHN
ncbi:MAG: hypothetical protein H6599_09465 [Flavobacteriales bacterium]|nr:hypothetical protein [Flavobacteriales bacterium]